MPTFGFLPVCFSLFVLILGFVPHSSSAATQLGEIVVEVLETEQLPDDGYWDWYVEHNKASKTFNRNLTETRMQLVYLASEISRAKAMVFNLERMYLEWQTVKDQSINFAGLNLGNYFQSAVHETAKVGPRALRSNRSRKQQQEESVAEWLQLQENLINKTIAQHKKIITRAKAQQKKSQKKRPALTHEVERLQDEHKLLPLFLYDYAAWYAPDKLPRVIKELTEKESFDTHLSYLLQAKAKVADAQELEKEAFIERLKPTKKNKLRILLARATIKGDPLGYLAGRTQVNEILKEVTYADVLQTTSQTQRLDAIALLRELLRTRTDPVAKALLIEQELYWLKRIAQKLEGQSEMAMSAFATYLANRGFDPVEREGWWPWLKDYGAAVWGLGPISSFAGMPGIDLPGANAELVGAQVMDAARNRISLVAIIKLLKAGNSLTELKALSVAEMSKLLQEYWGDSARTSAQRRTSVTKIAVDIHTSLRDLRDLDRLSTDDRFEFARDVNSFFAKNYFTPVDSRYQSFEWFGDLLNVHNLVTLWGPGAIVKVNGKWAKAPYMSFAEQDLLQKAGNNLASLSRTMVSQMLDSQKVLIAGYNLDTIGEMIRKTKTIQLIAKANAPIQLAAKTGVGGLLAKIKSISAITNAGRVAIDSSQLVANFFLNYAVTEVAKSTDIPGAALLTELLMSYEIPHGALDTLVFKPPAIPLQGMLAPLKRYQQQVSATSRLVTETSTSLAEASDLLTLARREPVAVTTTLLASPADRLTKKIDDLGDALQRRRVQQLTTVANELGVPAAVTVQAPVGSNGVTRIAPERVPQATVAASEDALLTAANALRSGDIDEAGRAIDAARTLMKTAQKDADSISKRVSEAIERLDEIAAAPPTAPADNFAEELAELVSKPTGDRVTVNPLIDPDVYQQGVTGEKIRLADDAMRRDDFDTALANLDDAKRYARELDETNGRLEFEIEQRRTLLAHARDAKGVLLQRRAETHQFPALERIRQSELDEILTKLKNGEFVNTNSGLNPAIEVTIGDAKFRLKPKQAVEQAEAEVVGGALADLLGFDTPGAKLVDAGGIEIQLSGETVSLDKVIVTRSIDQFVPLQDMEEHVLLALRADYAEQRALRAFLADSDGHLGNIGLGPNGKFWVIDTDLANFGSDHSLRQLGSAPFRNEGELIEAAVTFAHGELPANLHTAATDAGAAHLTRAIKSHPLYRWINRIDQLVQFQDMAGLVGRIKTLVSAEAKVVERLVEDGVERARAQQIFQLLQQRSEVLQDILSKPSLFGGEPVKFSCRPVTVEGLRVAAAALSKPPERRWAA